MAKTRKRSSWKFWLGAFLYAAVFLTLTFFGLKGFWGYMEAYENARPQNTVDAYMAQLTKEHMAENCGDLFDQVDQNLQSEEEGKAYILSTLDQPITCSKNLKESTEDRQVYTLRCGSRVIGSFVLSSTGEDAHGFAQWSVTEESFRFDYLMGESVTITVPDSFTVRVNGHVLDERYREETVLEYGLLEEFYGDYSLPGMVTYKADSFLGPMPLEALDPQGNVVEITPETDFEAYLDNCTEEEIAEVRALAEDFLKRYIQYCSGANGSSAANYAALWKCLVPNGALQQRLYSAISGLEYAQSHGDTVGEVTYHHFLKLEDGRYFCNFTYALTTLGHKGAVETVNNMKLILLPTDQGLRVENMQIY